MRTVCTGGGLIKVPLTRREKIMFAQCTRRGVDGRTFINLLGGTTRRSWNHGSLTKARGTSSTSPTWRNGVSGS